MNNLIAKTLIYNDEISLAVADTTELVNEAIRLHQLSPSASAAMGRALTVLAYMAIGLKTERGDLSFAIHGNGSGGILQASADAKLNLRACLENPQALTLYVGDEPSVSALIGNGGYLKVIRNDGIFPFTGTSEIISGDVNTDFMGYYSVSEQIPTLVNTDVKLNDDGTCAFAGGIFLQALPFASEESLVATENLYRNTLDVSSVLSDIRNEDDLLRITDELAPDHTAVTLHRPRYHCHCSRRYFERALVALGVDECRSILEEQGKISIHCQYCNSDYEFTEEDVVTIFSESDSE